MSMYLDRPLFDIRPDFQEVSAGLLDDFTFDSLGNGRSTPWKVTPGPKRTITYPFALLTRASINAVRKFFSDRKGRREGFWLPVYLRDYHLAATAAAGDSVLTIERVKLAEASLSFSQFKHLCLSTWGTLECAEISSVETVDDTEVITLSAPLAADWTADATLCGGVIMARLADDTFALDYGDRDTARANLKFVELPHEYDAAEAGADVIYLYKITRGADTWRLAAWPVDLTIAGYTWSAGDISHGDIVSGIELVSDPVDLQIAHATTDPEKPLEALLDRYTLEETYVTIYETTDGATLTQIHYGRVEDFEADEKGVMKAKISSAMRVAELIGPRIQQQRLCNHRLFDQFCGLAEGDYSTAGTVTATSIDPPYIEADEFGAKATAQGDPNWFALGVVKLGGETRLCVGQDGNRLYLNAPFRAAETAATATPGCDRRCGTCKTKFNNIANFLGFSYMPNENPQFEALQTPKQTGGKK